jgi:hypothetical protein
MAGDLDARDPSLRANRDMGDKVLVRFTEHGVGRTSGVGVTQEAFQLWDVRNGKAIRCEVSPRGGRPRSRGSAGVGGVADRTRLFFGTGQSS